MSEWYDKQRNVDQYGARIDVITYGIKYAGSKQKLIPYILKEATKYKPTSVMDVFSGTTRVSQAFSRNGQNVISNDLAVWSSTFAKAFLYRRNDKEVQQLIDHLNTLKPIHGWFTENYGGELNDSKKVWQSKNTRKLDAIRDEIDTLNLSDVNKSIALTSLILALDKVDSSLGHFTSYLKEWSARSYNDLLIEVPEYQGNDLDHIVASLDVLSSDFTA